MEFDTVCLQQYGVADLRKLVNCHVYNYNSRYHLRLNLVPCWFRGLDLRLEIAGSIASRCTVECDLGKVAHSHTLPTSPSTSVSWEVNRHTMRYAGPYPWSCRFDWCLAEGQRIGDQRRTAKLLKTDLTLHTQFDGIFQFYIGYRWTVIFVRIRPILAPCKVCKTKFQSVLWFLLKNNKVTVFSVMTRLWSQRTLFSILNHKIVAGFTQLLKYKFVGYSTIHSHWCSNQFYVCNNYTLMNYCLLSLTSYNNSWYLAAAVLTEYNKAIRRQ